MAAPVGTEPSALRPFGHVEEEGPPDGYYLIIVHPPELRRTIPVPTQDTEFGRQPDTGISLDASTLSRRHIALRYRGPEDGFWVEDLGSRNGSRLDGGTLAAGEPKPLAPGAVLRLADVVAIFERGGDVVDDEDDVGIPGRSPATVRLRQALSVAAPDRAPVLLSGETGTGKEYCAKVLHQRCGRSGPFLAINCAAVSAHLMESQLFGHRQGAFTGASEARDGLFRAADGGTLLLDEIGELPLELQPKLLRVLQEREVLPVGETRPRPVDVRIVAATLCDLRTLVEKGQFRLDLYARLATFEIRVPSLRERRADIPEWLEWFHERWYRERDQSVPPMVWDPDALEPLLLHAFEDNLRGLDRLVHRSAAAGHGRYVVSTLSPPVTTSTSRASIAGPVEPNASSADQDTPMPSPAPARRPVPSQEEFVAALHAHSGSIRALARHFDRDRRQIYRWVERYGLRATVEALQTNKADGHRG